MKCYPGHIYQLYLTGLIITPSDRLGLPNMELITEEKTSESAKVCSVLTLCLFLTWLSKLIKSLLGEHSFS